MGLSDDFRRRVALAFHDAMSGKVIIEDALFRGMTRRIAELEAAMRSAVEIIDANLYHQREKVEDAAAILRSALEDGPCRQ